MVTRSKGSDTSSFLSEVIEAGQRRVQKEFKISIRDICEFNDIKEGDSIVIYIKKTNIKNKRL